MGKIQYAMRYNQELHNMQVVNDQIRGKNKKTTSFLRKNSNNTNRTPSDNSCKKLSPFKNSSRILIGVAGVPGGGKSTISGEVCKRINQDAQQEFAIVLPMDGFHYTKAQLAQMQDPEMARFRRGAHWTFDGASFVECVKMVSQQPAVLAPSFQHGVGDPVADDILIQHTHKIVLVEGNYVLLDFAPWNELKQIFDESWYVDCALDEAMKRLFARQTGNGVAPETSNKRIQGNDRLNGELIQQYKNCADLIIPSLSII